MTDIDAIGILIVIVLIVLLGDAYSKEWCAGFYRTAGGLEYRQSPLPRSELYLEGQVHFMRGLVSIPPHATLLRELRLLERRVARSGKEQCEPRRRRAR